MTPTCAILWIIAFALLGYNYYQHEQYAKKIAEFRRELDALMAQEEMDQGDPRSAPTKI